MPIVRYGTADKNPVLSKLKFKVSVIEFQLIIIKVNQMSFIIISVQVCYEPLKNVGNWVNNV